MSSTFLQFRRRLYFFYNAKAAMPMAMAPKLKALAATPPVDVAEAEAAVAARLWLPEALPLTALVGDPDEAAEGDTEGKSVIVTPAAPHSLTTTPATARAQVRFSKGDMSDSWLDRTSNICSRASGGRALRDRVRYALTASCALALRVCKAAAGALNRRSKARNL